MSALPGIIGLIIFVYVRPQEFFEPLKDFNFLYIFLFLSLAGMANDVSKRRTVLMATPHLKYVIAFSVWCALTLVIRKPAIVSQKITGVLVCAILYTVIATGVQQVQGFFRLITFVFASGLFVAYVGADQGFSPFKCVVYNPADKNSNAFSDGRDCVMVDDEGLPHDGTADCLASGQPGLPYQCERAGLLGTTSCGGGRVRYLGVLLDPNELSLATALAVPFAFAFLEIRRTFFRVALLLVTIVIVGLEIVYTQSRGGQITLGAVLGAYFIKKYGWKRGILVGACLAVPMLALGGRNDESANESTLERLGCAAAGIKMLMAYPLTGVGYTEYTEYHFLTAHNAYVLAVGELGLPGMWLFGVLIFLAIKVPVSVLRFEMPETPDTIKIKALAMGMLAALIGGALGIFFLSWCYHFVLWIHLGMVGALYSCVKRQFPLYECKLTRKEGIRIFFGYVTYLVVWSFYIKSKGAWD
jgi:hypothetical protein